jgi:hypothetical protein
MIAAKSGTEMTARTWVGGQDGGNNAVSPNNWSPTGAPQPGDNLTVVTGTLDITGPSDLAGNTLHLQDEAIGGGPVVLDLNANGAAAAIDGSLNFGDGLIVNATGQDYLDALGGFNDIGGSINLADHAHLFMTGGEIQFFYGGYLAGGEGSKLTNYGYAGISAPVTSAQTVELNPGSVGMTLTLFDPADFHALLSVHQVTGRGNVSVKVKGVQADGFAILPGDRVMLTAGGVPVDMLRVANSGAVPITSSFDASGTTLTFNINHT